MRLIIFCLIVTCMFVGSVAGNFYLTESAIQSSNRRWCVTLELLTRRPVPEPSNPQSNPSRENAYVFYVNLLQLERSFGCKKGQ